MAEPPFTRVAIVGLGLLGASLAEAIRRRWPATRILAVSSPGAVAEALAAGAADAGAGYADLGTALADRDLVIFCTPIHSILATLRAWESKPPTLARDCVVTDVGSTKAAICAAGARALSGGGAHFIGSHPMAGSEKSGFGARDAHLFENAAWVLCPDAQAPAPAVARLEAFATGLGARTFRLDPATHDRVAAHVSHLPQLLSTALASFIATRPDLAADCLRMAGGGFRDMTRIAASPFALWEPILSTNAAEVAGALRSYRDHLDRVAEALDAGGLEPLFAAGNGLRARMSGPKKGFSVPLTEILVDLEDQPGMLVRALAPLAGAGVNILDLEILKVREGEDGTLMMAFKGADEAAKALGLLHGAGFRARLR